MLLNVHQLVANYTCVLLGADKVVDGGTWSLLHATSSNDSNESGEN